MERGPGYSGRPDDRPDCVQSGRTVLYPPVQPVTLTEPVDYVIFVGKRDIAPAVCEVLPVSRADEPVAGVISLRDRVLRAKGQPLEIPLHDEIDHAGNAIRTVDGGGATRFDVDPIDQVGRDSVDVDGGRAGEAGDMPAPVDQHQRAVSAEVAKVEQVDAYQL